MTKLTRRQLLSASTTGTAALLLGVSGCSSLSMNGTQDDDLSTLFANVVEQSSEPHDVAADEATFTANMAAVAMHFLDGLTKPLHAQATYSFGDEERYRWHWTTPRNFPRNGLPLREMDEEQKVRALDLLKASLSGVGLEKALNIMALQRDLGNDPELYYITILGIRVAASLGAGAGKGIISLITSRWLREDWQPHLSSSVPGQRQPKPACVRCHAKKMPAWN